MRNSLVVLVVGARDVESCQNASSTSGWVMALESEAGMIDSSTLVRLAHHHSPHPSLPKSSGALPAQKASKYPNENSPFVADDLQHILVEW
jgi:hypothetical protein